MSKRYVLCVVCLAIVVVIGGGIAGQDQSEGPRPRRVVVPVAPVEGGLRTSDATIQINKPMPAPAWALAEREVLALDGTAAEQWAARYLDANGHTRGPAHFGIADGPDDAVETIRNWSLAYALGGPESLIELWSKAWEGHLDQYSQAT